MSTTTIMSKPESTLTPGINYGPMLNLYPDSIGGTLADVITFLQRPELQNVFSSLYILPSLFHSDLDRGFSVQDYGLEESLATKADLEALRNLSIDLKLDFILNHASVLSPQFQDLLANGNKSIYRDFFIDWNKFWEGHGEMTEEGYIQPDPELIKDMFFRKPGLPILMVQFPDGSEVPYWNTFYQKVWEENGTRHYLGQMDLNIQSPLVHAFYRDTLSTLARYGAKIVRLDAFAYAPKAPGRRNFLNEPETWDFLEEINRMAAENDLICLPEIHASYQEGFYETLAEKGYMSYDFFLPGLIIDALESHQGERLRKWAGELVEKRIPIVTMLGCHDGIPLLDLRGILPEERIEELIEIIVNRGGYVKNLHGSKTMYYQVNATYYSALGENDQKMLLARALQLFMPGKPQVWYLDLFAGKNDHEAVARAGEGGHKEINRTNYSLLDADKALEREVVSRQLDMIRFRNTHPAFAPNSLLEFEANGNLVRITWTNGKHQAWLNADLTTYEFDYGASDDTQ